MFRHPNPPYARQAGLIPPDNREPVYRVPPSIAPPAVSLARKNKKYCPRSSTRLSLPRMGAILSSAPNGRTISSTGVPAISFLLPPLSSRNGKFFFPCIHATSSVGKVPPVPELPFSIRAVHALAFHPSILAYAKKSTMRYVLLYSTSF